MPSKQVFASQDNAVYTTSTGAPVAEPYAAQRVGSHGGLLLQDFHHIDLLAHFDRERIPERVVHAKGAGAHGYFEVTHDISDLSCASIFSKVGNKARATAGSADTARDPRGFAIKIKTDEGNLDWVFNNTPVFFIRDPAKFPHFIHTQKRDPQTHLKDADMFWDYLSLNPESIHQIMILFSDRGHPDGFHNMHGYSGHTYKFVNKDGSFHYVQIHVRKDGGAKELTEPEAGRIGGENPDYGIQSLFEAIEGGDFPSWTVYVQTMTAAQAEKFRYNILDLTKIWPHKEYPLRCVSPSHSVPGIEASADPVLQSRLFSYPDTHRHRLGVNYNQLPVNAPVAPVANFQRDGAMTFISQGGRPNYQSSLVPLKYKPKPYESVKHEIWLGHANADLSFVTELDFEQPRALWLKVFNDTDREHLVHNVVVHLKNAKSKEVKTRTLSYFATVDQSLSDRIAKGIGMAPGVPPLKVASASEAIRFQAFASA
ncbi:catalase [Fomitopsis serialis]|uniref:catalase n=1 Tax=Fomitopsis serialis TaxID=139415 RepID=UPI0020074574|nr:catalase [Neoantrodia serialis]KAH9913832.1 catalase [Neoantrodia serialis]